MSKVIAAKKTYITLEPKHFKGTRYDDLANDPLLRAVKQQYPELKVKTVYAESFKDGEGNTYEFDSTDATGYSRASYKLISKTKATRKVAFWMIRKNTN